MTTKSCTQKPAEKFRCHGYPKPPQGMHVLRGTAPLHTHKLKQTEARFGVAEAFLFLPPDGFVVYLRKPRREPEVRQQHLQLSRVPLVWRWAVDGIGDGRWAIAREGDQQQVGGRTYVKHVNDIFAGTHARRRHNARVSQPRLTGTRTSRRSTLVVNERASFASLRFALSYLLQMVLVHNKDDWTYVPRVFTRRLGAPRDRCTTPASCMKARAVAAPRIISLTKAALLLVLEVGLIASKNCADAAAAAEATHTAGKGYIHTHMRLGEMM